MWDVFKNSWRSNYWCSLSLLTSLMFKSETKWKLFPFFLPINGGNYDISRVTVQLNLKKASSEALVLLVVRGSWRGVHWKAAPATDTVCVPSSPVGTCLAWWQNTSPLPELLGGSWQLSFKFAVARGHLVSGRVWRDSSQSVPAEGQRCDRDVTERSQLAGLWPSAHTTARLRVHSQQHGERGHWAK